MRVYGRIVNADGTKSWVVVQTTNGNNDLVYFTALCQVLSLNLNESPFYATSGIPAQQSVSQQVPPDYYVALTQQAYAQFFAALQISRTSANPPTYAVTAIAHNGTILNAAVQVPT